MIDRKLFESKPSSNRSAKLRTRVYGFGVNDSPFVTQIQINGKKFLHPAYDCWKQMIRRCYAEESLAIKPHYADISVCDEWRSFSSFYSWWEENNVDGWEIDKDILTDNKKYSPQSCIFIPKWLNTFLSDARRARGKFLIGVTFNKKGRKFEAYCSDQRSGKQEYIGCFADELSAHHAWKKMKLSHANTMRDEMDSIDKRIYSRVVELIDRMK